MTVVDIEHLKTWIGREQQTSDVIGLRLVQSHNAIFDAGLDVALGDQAPAGIHWCLAPDIAPMNGLGPDGHPARGSFLPPVPFPRRMWAGGELSFPGAFLVGDEVSKRSVIEDVALKTGRSGSLIFVAVRHEYRTSRGLALTERQDIVYRESESGQMQVTTTASRDPSPIADRTDSIDATPTLLFRYSAVTFNGHRIHYDLDYVIREEGYPGLVFHGPLQASYLLRMAAASDGGRLPRHFAFRSVKPLFAGGQVKLNLSKTAAGISLWVSDQSGETTMTASATS